MKLPDEIINIILHGDINMLYDWTKLIADQENLKKEWDKVENGIRLKFCIRSELEKKYKPQIEKTKSGLIYIDGEWLNINDYWKEIQDRKSIMLDIFQKYVITPDIYTEKN